MFSEVNNIQIIKTVFGQNMVLILEETTQLVKQFNPVILLSVFFVFVVKYNIKSDFFSFSPQL